MVHKNAILAGPSSQILTHPYVIILPAIMITYWIPVYLILDQAYFENYMKYIDDFKGG